MSTGQEGPRSRWPLLVRSSLTASPLRFPLTLALHFPFSLTPEDPGAESRLALSDTTFQLSAFVLGAVMSPLTASHASVSSPEPTVARCRGQSAQPPSRPGERSAGSLPRAAWGAPSRRTPQRGDLHFGAIISFGAITRGCSVSEDFSRL